MRSSTVSVDSRRIWSKIAPEIPLWAETTTNLQSRLQRLAAGSQPEREGAQLSYLLRHEREHLRFRAAAVGDVQGRLDALLDARRNLHPPT